MNFFVLMLIAVGFAQESSSSRGKKRYVDTFFTEIIPHDDDFPVYPDSSSPESSGSIPGRAGYNYPVFASVPYTSFSCDQQPYPGYYADTEAHCQVYHICQTGGRMDSFLCPNGTMFNQAYLVCDWWYNVKCEHSKILAIPVNEAVTRDMANSDLRLRHEKEEKYDPNSDDLMTSAHTYPLGDRLTQYTPQHIESYSPIISHGNKAKTVSVTVYPNAEATQANILNSAYDVNEYSTEAGYSIPSNYRAASNNPGESYHHIPSTYGYSNEASYNIPSVYGTPYYSTGTFYNIPAYTTRSLSTDSNYGLQSYSTAFDYLQFPRIPQENKKWEQYHLSSV